MSISSSLRLRRGSAAVTLLVLSAALSSSTLFTAASGDTQVYSDDFESGSLGGWTVTVEGQGSADVVPGAGYADTAGARLTVPNSTTGSIAFLRKALETPSYGLSAEGRFKVLAGGCNEDAGYSAGNIPFFRFFDADYRRVVGLYRINGSCSKTAKLYVQHSDNFYRTGKNISIGTWYRMELRAAVQEPGRSLVQVYLDGAKVYETTIADNGIRPFASVTTHNEHRNQAGDMVVDDVTLSRFEVAAPDQPCTGGSATAPTNDQPGSTILADGFESYDFSRWTSVTRLGDATATIGSSFAHREQCGARLHVTTFAGSKANLTKSLPQGTTTVRTDGWYRVAVEGPAGNNVPFMRLFSDSTRVVDLYRQNGNGVLYLRTRDSSGRTVYTSLRRVVDVGTWNRLGLRVTTAGASSTVEVSLNGERIYTSDAVSLAAGGLTSGMVGSEHFAQAMDLDVDDVVIKVE